MNYDFYHSREYREKQSRIMKANWRQGLFDFRRRREKRRCVRKGCNNIFQVKPSDPKIYCCRSCAGKVNNAGRGPLLEGTKLKIAKALIGRKNPYAGTIIEVKNFLWKYSKIRDKKFRKLYPNISLILLLKEDYLKLEKSYAQLIKNWEYKNSPFLNERKPVVVLFRNPR